MDLIKFTKPEKTIKSKVEIRFFELFYPAGHDFELVEKNDLKVCVKLFGDKICYDKIYFEEKL